MLIDRDTLARILRQNNCSLTKTAYDLGVTPQRVEQLCKSRGIKIGRTIEYVEPQQKLQRDQETE